MEVKQNVPIYSNVTQEGHNSNIKNIKVKNVLMLIKIFHLWKRIKGMRGRG